MVVNFSKDYNITIVDEESHRDIYNVIKVDTNNKDAVFHIDFKTPMQEIEIYDNNEYIGVADVEVNAILNIKVDVEDLCFYIFYIGEFVPISNPTIEIIEFEVSNIQTNISDQLLVVKSIREQFEHYLLEPECDLQIKFTR